MVSLWLIQPGWPRISALIHQIRDFDVFSGVSTSFYHPLCAEYVVLLIDTHYSSVNPNGCRE